jgi:hypothetical protein
MDDQENLRASNFEILKDPDPNVVMTNEIVY